jgi:hypothetical protein
MATYVKGNAVANATSYELLEKTDGTYTSLAEASEINFEVSALNLASGDHTLVVKAKANGYVDSDYSNEVVYSVAGESGGDTGDDSGNGTSGVLDLSAGTLMSNKTLASETYTTTDSSSGYFTVMEVPAEPNTTYNIESGVLRRTWYVDSSKAGISSVNLKTEKTFTTLENTAYISFTCATSDCSYDDIVIKKA